MSGRTRGRGRGRGRGGAGGPKSASQQYLLSSAQEAGVDVRHLRGMASAGAIFPDLELHSSGERKLLAHESEELQNGKSGGDGAAAGGDGGDDVTVKQEPGSTSSAPSTSASDDAAHKTPEKPRSADMIYLISKSREMHHRMQSSVFYIRTTKGVPDVARYSDRLRPPPNVDASAVLSHCLGGRKRTRGEGGGVFVPEELCGGQRRISNMAGTADGERKKKAKGLNLDELEAKMKHEGDADNEEEEQKQEGEEGEEEESEEESDDADYVTNYYESEGDESKGSGGGEPTF